MTPVEITRLRKSGGPLTKTFHREADGTIRNDSSRCCMARGEAERLVLKSPHDLAAELDNMPLNGALALGCLRAGLPDKITLVAEKALGRNPGAYARSQDNFCYPEGRPGYVLCDYDQKGMPDAVCARIEALGGFVPALESLCPAIANAASVLRASTSFGVHDPATGTAYDGGGTHFYIAIASSSDAARFLKALHKRAWLADLGWYLLSKSGAFLERSIVDVNVASPERIVFEANPILNDGLVQYRRLAIVHEGVMLDSLTACPDLDPREDKAVKRRQRAEQARLKPESERAQKSFIEEKTAEAIARGVSQEAAQRMAEQWANQVLYPDALLIFDDLGPVTVGELLADPARFEKETLADPIEGVEYGTNKAIVYQYPNGKPWIFSFAHGETRYTLAYDPEAEGPLPLFSALPPAAPYPVEALGPVLAPAAQAIVRKVQVPAAIAGQSVLAAASFAACPHADVRLPFSHARPLTLYFMTVATSGDRKSAADEEALGPVRKREWDLKEQRKEELKTWRIAHAGWAAEKKKIERDRKIDALERIKLLTELGEEPVEPLDETLIVDDPTIEGITKNWPKMHAALGIFTAEGGKFTGGYGMNKDNRLKTASMLCEAWDGVPIKRVRALDGITSLYGRRLAMHLLINRAAAATFIGDSSLRDQGLLSRFLLAYPESIAGTRLYKETDPEDEATIRRYSARILSLLEKSPALVSGHRNELNPLALMFTAEAKRLWIAFYNRIERQCGDPELLPVKDVIAKTAEQAARIAGVLTVVEDHNAREIGLEAMKGGVALANWYLAEAKRLQSDGAVDPVLVRAERLLEWIKTQPGGVVGVRKILNQGPNATRTKAAAEQAIGILRDHGSIVEVSVRPRMLKAVKVPI